MRFFTKKICKVPDCEDIVDAKGSCNSHYKKWRRWGDPMGAKPALDYVENPGEHKEPKGTKILRKYLSGNIWRAK